MELTPEMVAAGHAALQRHLMDVGVADLDLAVEKVYLAMAGPRPPIEELGDGSEDE